MSESRAVTRTTKARSRWFLALWLGALGTAGCDQGSSEGAGSAARSDTAMQTDATLEATADGGEPARADTAAVAAGGDSLAAGDDSLATQDASLAELAKALLDSLALLGSGRGLAIDGLGNLAGLADESAEAGGLPPSGVWDRLLRTAFLERAEVAAGIRITASSDWHVSTLDHEEGDPVVATISAAITDSAGTVLVPEGAKLLGRVTSAQRAFGPGEKPYLAVRFETLSAPDWERPVETRVVEPEIPEIPEGPEDAVLARLDDETGFAGGEIPAGAVLQIELQRPLILPPDLDELLPDVNDMTSPLDTMTTILDTLRQRSGV